MTTGHVEKSVESQIADIVHRALNERFPGVMTFGPTRVKEKGNLAGCLPRWDLPMIDTVIVEVANPSHPYGVGEVPIVPPLAAVANAVGAATNQRLTSLPITPGSVLEAEWNGG